MADTYNFIGKWITNGEFAESKPKNVFHKQLEDVGLREDSRANRHILFRKSFSLEDKPSSAVLYISADDYYKVYINGVFAAQGPAAGYPFSYNYNTIDVGHLLKKGENLIAVHTLYQGLINRVWMSGDGRHGLILDLLVDGKLAVMSDTSFLTHLHTAYRETGKAGYDTQFLEEYDSGAKEVGFEKTDFDDGSWEHARLKSGTDYTLVPQATKMLEFEEIYPKTVKTDKNRLFYDFGGCYVGYLVVEGKGKRGERVTVRCGQETENGGVRYKMRCNCTYEEQWILSGENDRLDWFDYKSFRYAELIVPDGFSVEKVYISARHYPFVLSAEPLDEFRSSPELMKIWQLCVNTLRYGPQEVIMDCMDREKGFYVGDGCYTSLAHLVLTGDDSITRYLIDSAIKTTAFNPGTVTCLNCSFMQEIAEYPLILIFLILWHYKLTGDREYLDTGFEFAKGLLETYRRQYEKDLLLQNLDKWCVVDWPEPFRDGYDVDITEGKVCEVPHMVINAYYIKSVETVNEMAAILDKPQYRDAAPLREKFLSSFYDEKRKVFKDSIFTEHSSYISNVFAYGFDLCPDREFTKRVIAQIYEKGIRSCSFFSGFALMYGAMRRKDTELIRFCLLDRGAWLRMLDEGATTTFESWGKDTKWNTSLFHLTLSFASIFMAKKTYLYDL